MWMDWLRKLFNLPVDTPAGKRVSGLQVKSSAEKALQQVIATPQGQPALISLVNSAGRINYIALQNYLERFGRESTLEQLGHPVFMGQELVSGRFLSRQARASSSGVDGTSLFVEQSVPAKSNLKAPPQPDSMGGAVYVLIKAHGNPNHFTIGRTTDSDLTFSDHSVSKEHGQLSIMDGRYFLRDTQSTNGTTVNGKVVKQEEVELQPGDEVIFGRLAFQFMSPQMLYDKLKELG